MVKRLCLLCGLTVAALSAHAANVGIQKTARFDKDAAVPAAVKAECDLETKIPNYVFAEAKGEVQGLSFVDKPGAGRTLSMTIKSVAGSGGGAWSGPKQVTIEGKLLEKNKVVGSFVATRFSSGGAFGAYKGTCKILDRCAKALGKDVAGWLMEPTMNARLGDAR